MSFLFWHPGSPVAVEKLATYALSVSDVGDVFSRRRRALLTAKLVQLPPHTRPWSSGV